MILATVNNSLIVGIFSELIVISVPELKVVDKDFFSFFDFFVGVCPSIIKIYIRKLLDKHKIIVTYIV